MGRILATLGYDLVMVSHREQHLSAAAAEIGRAHGVRTLAIAMDLGRESAAEELYQRVSAEGVTVDILINNAGFFFFGEISDADPAQARAMLLLHVLTPSLLCTLFTRGMRERRRGHVMVVSSLSAVRDFPGIGYYGASKKYLRGFTRSLRSDLGPYGVNVTCLSPGATATGLYDPSVVPVDLAKKLGVMMDPADVARAGLTAMFAGEAESMPGTLTRVMAAAAGAAPQSLVDFVRRRGPWLKGPR